jgi:hypothetical protein
MLVPRWLTVVSLWFQGLSAGVMLMHSIAHPSASRFLLLLLITCSGFQAVAIHTMIAERRG